MRKRFIIRDYLRLKGCAWGRLVLKKQHFFSARERWFKVIGDVVAVVSFKWKTRSRNRTPVGEVGLRSFFRYEALQNDQINSVSEY